MVNVPSEYVSPVQSAHLEFADEVPIEKDTINNNTWGKENFQDTILGNMHGRFPRVHRTGPCEVPGQPNGLNTKQ